MALNIVDPEYFDRSKPLFPIVTPKCKISELVRASDSETVGTYRFPINIKDMVKKSPYAQLKSIQITYCPLISMTNHGTISITIRDNRKSSFKENVIVRATFPTEIFFHMEINDLEPCSRNQKCPITMSISHNLKGVTPNAIIGEVKSTAMMRYFGNLMIGGIPRVTVSKISQEGYSITRDHSAADAMMRVKVEYNS
ncbi:TPA_asm: P3 [Ipomoea betacytorhabdovirus 1]|nr:TPA_asm: P3 [Ipomoea betacytorhabdovirus 1]